MTFMHSGRSLIFDVVYYCMMMFAELIDKLLYEVSVSLWHFQVCEELPVSSGIL